jgi:hypothetical protein
MWYCSIGSSFSSSPSNSLIGVVSSISALLWGVVAATADRVRVGVGVSTRIDGRHVGRGCAAYVVVFFDGSKAERRMASWSSGHIPVFQKADWIVAVFSAVVGTACSGNKLIDYLFWLQEELGMWASPLASMTVWEVQKHQHHMAEGHMLCVREGIWLWSCYLQHTCRMWMCNVSYDYPRSKSGTLLWLCLTLQDQNHSEAA